MIPDGEKTAFLPPDRSTRDEIEQAKKQLLANPYLARLLDGVPLITLLLNSNRQVLVSNRAIAAIADGSLVEGLRPGELLDCVHARETEGGCGTTEFCRVCGAAKAILSSQEGKSDVQECRITKTNGEALDLRVWTSPFDLSTDKHTFFSIMDITDEKRRRWLERIFFHDVLNSVSGIYAAAEIIKDIPSEEKDKLAEIILQASQRVVDEIGAQKDLTAAENGELAVKFDFVSSAALLQDLCNLYGNTDLARGKKLIIQENTDIGFETDRRLLFRVLGNMVKNALEATGEGASIILGAERVGDNIRFSVSNPGVMPENVRLQIFQRSFSTKAVDRGLGTYSIKFLSERYLQGSVSFVSSHETGTVFFAQYPIHPR